MSSRRIVATSGLPYANSSIHIGHLVEYTQTDIWTRFQKMRGHECLYICGDDTHGTAIMISAKDQGITPEKLLANIWQEHKKDFNDFEIEFDEYSSTNTATNKALSEEIFKILEKNNSIRQKDIEQLYCDKDKTFLPDRFVKGTCPKCSSPDQYGDNCDKCGATYSPSELKSPYCSHCGTPPINKKSSHIFFKLGDFTDYLKTWVPDHTQKSVSNKMQEWLGEGLRDWDISRDEPYFGFEIPGHPGKYFYVWVDAPMGYISGTAEWCKKNNKDLKDYWKNKNTEIYHFIGKDIIYFHTLFWPAMLKNTDYNSPTQIFVHGMLMVNGEKMSKSKGTNIPARVYLNHVHPMYLRYYYASKLMGDPSDIDLNFEDFVSRVNGELVGKITNLGSRGAQMLTKKMDSIMSESDNEGLKLIQQAQALSETIATHYENRDYAKALHEIRSIADEANKYFDEKAPWKTLESNPEETKKVITGTLNLFRIIAIYLKPILPSYTDKVANLFNEKPYVWSSVNQVLKNHKVNDYTHLASRIEMKQIEAMIEENKKLIEAKAKTAKKIVALAPTNASSEIEFDDFAKVDLRVAKIIHAEEIKEADKLLRLKVDIGELGQRQIIAGIKSAYKAEDLIGRLTVVVANLKPRQMKFGMSEGMVLAAGAGGKDLFILTPDSGSKPGDKVK